MTSVSAINDLFLDPSLTITTSIQCDTVLGEVPGWTEEDAKKWKKEQHRANMVAFRLKKKQKKQKLKGEHRRLEKEMEELSKRVHDVAAKREVSGVEGVSRALQELVVEREALSKQNLALREEITRHQELQKALMETEEETEAATLLPSDEKDGWRVHFPTDAPSFHFYPYTQDEYEAEMQSFDEELSSSVAKMSLVGTFLGWNVYRAPLTVSQTDGTSILARARFSKRLRCPLDVHLQVSATKQKDLSPVIVTPIGWGLKDRPAINTQMLQQFDQDSFLFVHNIPGEVNLRYLFQLRRAEWKLLNGRRKLTFSMNIVDSDANRRSREAEGPQDNVEWFTEGGLHVSLMEVDDNFIDVVSDHWVSCRSALHAEHMMVQWAQVAIWWEQKTVPSSLLVGRSSEVFDDSEAVVV
ncbi:hypothetical protein PHYBOEH_011815 [Phytophthora boehmeriae]|uniref:BZIP domain-containing protein n=1 Tax=Phytophthora boehmeriae TaxID=109152 RepID=A0A8T1VJP4_9STRA|nr:hypothetical protein PHYBOEH_011815 [Phytophthora boehmeriae]